MNREEFIREVKESGIEPSDFDQMYDLFTQYQQQVLHTLKVFHNLCEANGIIYVLAYGSLLGAVRDNGIIPWDYDVDVVVPFYQRDLLNMVLREQLPKGFYYVGIETNRKCPRDITRIAPIGYDSDILHVDVFYLAAAPEDDDARYQLTRRLRQLQIIRHNKYRNLRKESHGRPYLFLHYLWSKLKTITISDSRLRAEHDSLCSSFDINKTPYLVPTGYLAQSDLFDNTIFTSTELFETSYGHFRVPTEYKKILESKYGDWERIPSLENRLHEIKKHYDQMVER